MRFSRLYPVRLSESHSLLPPSPRVSPIRRRGTKLPSVGHPHLAMASSNGKPVPGEEGKTPAVAAEGSIGGYESLHRLLEANLSPELFKVPPSPAFFAAQIHSLLSRPCHPRRCLRLVQLRPQQLLRGNLLTDQRQNYVKQFWRARPVLEAVVLGIR